jgi:hypothetical protein
MTRTKNLAFFVLVIFCIAAIAISILVARRGWQRATATGNSGQPQSVAGAHSGLLEPSASGEIPHAGKVPTDKRDPGNITSGTGDRSHSSQSGNQTGGNPQVSQPGLLYFRANALGENYGKLAVAKIEDLTRINYSSELRCERIHFSAGAGVCLVADLGVFTSYYAVKFDDRMQRGWTIKLNGAPSRVRVSPSGRLAAITVFLPGSSHSYSAGTLSTQTTIVDVASGTILTDLEQFAVTRDGQPFKSPDFNFWGVTFMKDENRFYATLWTNNHIFLVEANLAGRTAKVIHDGVECPSLSPDNRRIAFKKRVTGGPPYTWRITLLDLESGVESALGEARNVDDQVEWLDNQHVLYALSSGTASQSSASSDIWVLPATADGVPKVMVTGGSSPAVVVSRAIERESRSARLTH